MKRKLKEEIKNKTTEELVKDIAKKQAEIEMLKMDIKMARVKDTSSLKRKRDELAVMETILEEKTFKNI